MNEHDTLFFLFTFLALVCWWAAEVTNTIDSLCFQRPGTIALQRVVLYTTTEEAIGGGFQRNAVDLGIPPRQSGPHTQQ